MKSRLFELVFVLLFLFVTVFNMVGYIIDSFFYSMRDLPTGKFLYSAMSPDGTATLRLYKVQLQGVGEAVRGEIVTSDGKKDAPAKNVYWQVGTGTAIAAWVGETALVINGNEVYVDGDAYDSRRQIELPEASAKNRLSK